ncbi:MAG: hypothetical protein AB7H92_17925 [Microbacteriaceae bacterium]
MEVIGRQQMIDEVVRRLHAARLVTVTGPGGIGKTTLADAVAQLETPRFPLGVHRVDLTLIEDGAEVAPALAAQLGFGSFQALLDSPTDDPALVVIDNCEHVLDAAAEAVAALLEACRSPTVLATSRSPLGLPAESVVALGPLALPGDDGDERGAPAVQLFVERARAAGVDLPDAEVVAVARLCRLLDGVPLAIELAAARCRVLGPAQLLERLGDLDTLRRSRPRGPQRHRSVRDTIAWSYDLLEDGDKRLFDRLAVLPGPFTADDAHAVSGDGAATETMDRLERLVADSLLATQVVSGVAYHRQLELVRNFARERLIAAGGWDRAWQRLVDHVTACSITLIAASSPGWDRSGLAALLGRVELHLAVLRWCIEHDDRPSRSFVLVSTLWGVVHQGRLADIAPLAEQALERWNDPTLEGWADAAATAATCRYLAGRPQEAIDLAHTALEHVGDARFAPCTLRRVIGHARVARGDVAGAIETLSGAIALAEERAPALAMEMTVSRAELLAAAAPTTMPIEGLLQTVRTVAGRADDAGSAVNAIWARSVEATLLARTDREQARVVAARALTEAGAAVYPAAESVNLHTLASLLVDDGDLSAAAALLRRLIDGLIARGAATELRNGLRLSAVALERAQRPAWDVVAAHAATLPVVSLFSIPGHEGHPLPAVSSSPPDARTVIAVVRRELDALAGTTPEQTERYGAADARPRQTPRPPDPTEQPANAWSCAGELWTLRFEGRTVYLRTSKGLADLGRLLTRPGTAVHCTDLAGVAVADRATGEVLDDRARRQYEQRVRELQRDIDEAEHNADHHRADRARAELDAIVDHLTAALGLGGRTRRHTDNVERARSAVTQRIRATIKRIRAVHPSLAAHLDASIQTGTYCRYQPERPTVWSTVTADVTT